MKKKFIYNISFVLLLNVLIKPFWVLGIDRTVQNTVGSLAYGQYITAYSFSLLFAVLLDLGINTFNNNHIARHRHLLTKYFSYVFVLKLLLGGVYLLVSLGIAGLAGYSSAHIELLILMLANQWFISLTQYMRSNLSGLHLFVADSVLSVFDRAVMIVVCLFVFWGNSQNFDVMMFAWIQTGCYFFTFVVALGMVYGRLQAFRLRFSGAFFYLIIKQSTGFALLTLLMSLYNRVDVVLLERLLPHGYESSGLYAQSLRILDSLSMFAVLFSTLLMPMFARMFKQRENITELLQLSFKMLFIPAVTLSLSFHFFAPDVIKVLYNEHWQASANIFSVLILAFIPISISYIFGTLLTAGGFLKQLNYISLTGLLLSIGLNLWLIPVYEAQGTAYAAIITQTVVAILHLGVAYKYLKLKIQYQLLARFAIFVVGLYVVGSVLVMFNIPIIIRLLAMGSIGIILSLVMRLIKIQQVLKILGK